MRKLTMYLLLTTQVLLVNSLFAQTNIIKSFDEFMILAKTKSLTMKNGEIELTQAKREKLISILGVLDPTGNVALSYFNNTQLPVNLIPSEILGGQPGTFQEVQFGVQYNTNFNTNIDVKLINPAGWESLKLSKLNISLADNNSKIALKDIYENSAVIFFYIATLQEQLETTKINLKGAEQLYQTTQNKYQAGQVSKQDLNESEVNKKIVEEHINQIQFLIKQQYIGLKMLCDIPNEVEILIQSSVLETSLSIEVQNNQLRFNNALICEQILLRNFNKIKYSFLPTLSAFASISQQQFNSQARLFDNVNWIPSSYIGLRLSMTLPSASSISQYNKARYEYQIAKNGAEQLRIQSKLTTNQLTIDYEKAFSQRESNKQIYRLYKDTYEKNLVNYEAGILSLEQTIRSFNEMVNSQYNLISSEKMVEMTLAKININNAIN